MLIIRSKILLHYLNFYLKRKVKNSYKIGIIIEMTLIEYLKKKIQEKNWISGSINRREWVKLNSILN